MVTPEKLPRGGGAAAHPPPGPLRGGKVVHCDLVALSSALRVSAPRTDAAAGARPAARPRPLAPAPPPLPLPRRAPSPHLHARPFPAQPGAENFERRSQWRAGGTALAGTGAVTPLPPLPPLSLPPRAPPPPAPRPRPSIALPSECRPQPPAPNLDSSGPAPARPRSGRPPRSHPSPGRPIGQPLPRGIFWRRGEKWKRLERLPVTLAKENSEAGRSCRVFKVKK